ncbi:MAG: hypothetical protein L0G87_00440 [Renibacterium salmoninarum]|nr:hypothetical protein [Renibacterium salmoninarum]
MAAKKNLLTATDQDPTFARLAGANKLKRIASPEPLEPTPQVRPNPDAAKDIDSRLAETKSTAKTTTATDRPDNAQRRIAPVQFFIPSAMKRDFIAYTKAKGISQPMAILLAVQDAYPIFPQLLGTSTVGVAGGKNLFDLPKSVVIKLDGGEAKDASITVKMLQSNLEILDELVKEFGAPSRNHLVYVALKHLLTTA